MELKDIDLNNIDLFVNGDPHAAWKILREQAPVHWNHKDNTGYWSITRHQDALYVYRNPLTFSSERGGVALNYGLIDEEAMAQQAGFGQMLIVTAGTGWIQTWGGPIQEFHQGDIVLSLPE